VIGGPEVDTNFASAARNIPLVDVLPNAGLNVYDVLRRDTLVLTRAAIEAIEARFADAGEPPLLLKRPRDAGDRSQLRHHPRPGDHREGDPAQRAEQGRVPRRADATKDQIATRWSPCSTSA
jgi:hypothetical protein